MKVLNCGNQYTIKVKVYIGSAFVESDPIIKEMAIDESKIEYIYNNGIVNSKFGEVKLIADPEGLSIADFQNDKILCQTSSRCSLYNAVIGTSNNVDLSQYEAVVVRVNCEQYLEGNFGPCIISTNSTPFSYIGMSQYVDGAANMNQAGVENKEYELYCKKNSNNDAYKNNNGLGHVGITFTYDKFYVSQLYLVKK